MLLNFINLKLTTKIKSLDELPMRIINKISYHLQFPPAGFGRYHVNLFIKNIAKKYDVKDKKLLDVGAGHQPYKRFFKQLIYSSCDSESVIKEMKYNTLNAKHDFYCNINEKIPVIDEAYDYILCSEVLEHVYNPDNVIREMSRILKIEGLIFITAPQCGGEHMLPHNYFNYLGPGLEYLLKKNNLKPIKIYKPAGTFHLIGTLLNKITNNLFSFKNNFIKFIVFPLELSLRIILYFINFILFYLDKVDKNKTWCQHYFVIAKKTL